MNPIADLRNRRTRNWCQKNGVDLWRWILERVPWVLGCNKADLCTGT